MSTLSIAIIIVFIVGYLFIALESVTKVNKAAVALLMFVVVWTLYMLNPGYFVQLMHPQFMDILKLEHPGLGGLRGSRTYVCHGHHSEPLG